MQSAQQQKYLETAIQTATPEKLLIFLMDGAIRYCKLSKTAIEEKKIEEANRYLNRVQDIISEFVITLDTKSPFAENLLLLYDYFIHRLIQANTEKSVEPIEEVQGYLAELKETWIEAAKLSKAEAEKVRHG